MTCLVCITTCRRPAELVRLLSELDALAFVKSPAPALEVLVIDNDPAGSAAEACRRAAAGARWPVRYVHEPVPGISRARNRALSSVDDDTEFLVFIDDDEIPAATWLDELLATQRATGADVVAGPVLSRFETAVPGWIARDGFFNRVRRPTGSPVDIAAAGNVLIKADVIRAGARFDDRFGLTGGEDTLFFGQLARRGYRLVWADDAVAWEIVPASRARAGWILRRAFRVGSTWARCEWELHRSIGRSAGRWAKGMARIAQGTLLLPLSLPRGRRGMLQSLRWIAVGTGTLAGLMGARFEEYRRAHRP